MPCVQRTQSEKVLSGRVELELVNPYYGIMDSYYVMLRALPKRDDKVTFDVVFE